MKHVNCFKTKNHTLKYTSLLSLNSPLTICSLVSNGPDEDNGKIFFFSPHHTVKSVKMSTTDLMGSHKEDEYVPYCYSKGCHITLLHLPLCRGGKEKYLTGQIRVRHLMSREKGNNKRKRKLKKRKKEVALNIETLLA